MITKRIDGISVISESGDITFESGLPESEQLFPRAVTTHGTATLLRNGCFQFKSKHSTPVGTPSMDTLLRAEGLIIKRSARNFIVTMKFPIFEKNVETSNSHKNYWHQTEALLKTEREKIKTTF